MQEINSRSVIIGGITEDIPLDKLIRVLQQVESNHAGQKIIESIDVYDYDKIRLIFVNKEGKHQHSLFIEFRKIN